MNKKIAILLNTPILGGAERSIVQQIDLLGKNYDYTFFIPIIQGRDNQAEQLVALIDRLDANILFFEFPQEIYKVSRSQFGINPFKIGLSFISLLHEYKKMNLSNYDVIWANGNKVGVSSLLYCFIYRYRNTFVWHFRDYPSDGRKFSLIWKLLSNKFKFKTQLIGNSISVSKELSRVTSNKTPVKTIYNPVSDYSTSSDEFKQNDITIGFAGMFAPWKGIHELILWASLYEQKLLELQITKIRIFGDEIYLTSGEHSGYKNQLEELLCKFPNSLVEFAGIVPPDQIYKETDILIHTSLDPEPFGRVITEAFSAGIPVITTGLGGAGELVEDNQTGIIHFSNDFSGLFLKVKEIIVNSKFRDKIITNAKTKRMQIESQIKKGIQDIVDS
jgi:glycosyltransferase involved in cell wall biosynthesis